MARTISIALLSSLCLGFSPQMEQIENYFPEAAFAHSFPKGTWIDEEHEHAMIASRYVNILTSLQEPPLPAMASARANVIYRFTCIRSFHKPFTITISQSRGAYLLQRKEITEGGELFQAQAVAIPAKQVFQLHSLLTDLKFWDMAHPSPRIGLDGSHWLIEAVHDGRYNIIDRWSPEEGEAAHQIGSKFLQTAKWSPNNLY